MRVFYVVIRAQFGAYPRDGVSLVRRDSHSYDLRLNIGHQGHGTAASRLARFATLGTVHVFRAL